MKKQREWITAAELQEQLYKDPEYQSRKGKLDQEFEERERMLEADEASLVEDLANIGLEVKSVYDLVLPSLILIRTAFPI